MGAEGYWSHLSREVRVAWPRLPVLGQQRHASIWGVHFRGIADGVQCGWKRQRRIKVDTQAWGSSEMNANTINWDGDSGEKGRLWGEVSRIVLFSCI